MMIMMIMMIMVIMMIMMFLRTSASTRMSNGRSFGGWYLQAKILLKSRAWRRRCSPGGKMVRPGADYRGKSCSLIPINSMGVHGGPGDDLDMAVLFCWGPADHLAHNFFFRPKKTNMGQNSNRLGSEQDPGGFRARPTQRTWSQRPFRGYFLDLGGSENV